MKNSGESESKQNSTDKGFEDAPEEAEKTKGALRALRMKEIHTVLNHRNPKVLPVSAPRDTIRVLREQRKRSYFEEMISIYGIMDSSLDSFAKEFRSVLPKEFQSDTDQFRHYIEHTLSADAHKPLAAIEFGGPGLQLFSGFTPRFFDHTIGVCLTYKSKKPAEADETDHTIIKGDIFHASTYREVRHKLGDQEAGLIISRMAGPLHDMTRNPTILGKIISTWYGLLTDESAGLMFIEYPQSGALHELIEEWSNYIEEHFSDTIEVQVGYQTLRLLKKKGAPEALPLLKHF